MPLWFTGTCNKNTIATGAGNKLHKELGNYPDLCYFSLEHEDIPPAFPLWKTQGLGGRKTCVQGSPRPEQSKLLHMFWRGNHRIIESFRLEKTFKIESNCKPNIAVSTRSSWWQAALEMPLHSLGEATPCSEDEHDADPARTSVGSESRT